MNSANPPCKLYFVQIVRFLLIQYSPIYQRLQQVADAGIALILLVAFSLVLAGASVFIVNERVNGEKLQQKLCGVKFATYWGVTFFWDLIVRTLHYLRSEWNDLIEIITDLLDYYWIGCYSFTNICNSNLCGP